jgi:hypothetical protein
MNWNVLRKVSFAAISVIFSTVSSANAATFNISLSRLTGLTGGSPAATAVYYADLSPLPLSTITSIQISDNSSGLGGATGQFTGFDIDAIKLSYTLAADALAAASLVGLSVFDFTPTRTFFIPGTQRLPTDTKLFGTTATGTNIDNAVATLGTFDGNSTTAIPGADGFVSLGDNGKVTFNLTSSVSSSGLYLYLGEVGDNGEIVAGSITISDQPINVPEPASILSILGLGTLGAASTLKRKLKSSKSSEKETTKVS